MEQVKQINMDKAVCILWENRSMGRKPGLPDQPASGRCHTYGGEG